MSPHRGAQDAPGWGLFSVALKVGGKRDLLVKDSAYDAAGSKSRMFDRATSNGKLDPTKARQGFAIYDDADPTLRGSYHLPFADVVGGELTAIGNGVRNALSRLPQLDGAPQAVQDDAQALLEGYMKKLNPDYKPGSASGDNATPLTVGPSDVLWASRIATLRAQPSSEQLMQMAMAAAPDPTVFAEAPPYFVHSIISTNSLDSFGTIMARSTLQNFAQDAAEGRAVLVGHDHEALPIGYSLSGVYKDGRHAGVANGEAHVASDAYLVPGTGMANSPADMVIRGIRAGTTRDVSVGFFGGTYRCSLCDRELGDLACAHIPGLHYLFGARTDDPTSDGEPAALMVHGARLAEYSYVFDGSTPGAGIAKARMLSAAGRMRPEWAAQVETRWGVRVAAAPPLWAPGAAGLGASPLAASTPADPPSPLAPPPSAATTPKEKSTMELHEAIRSVVTDAGLTPSDEPEVMVRALGAEVLSLRAQVAEVPTLKAEVERLRPLADQGTAYRTDLITATLAEGVRAHGADFAAETYRGLLEAAPLDTIKRMQADWQALGDKQFPGGRLTQDDGEKAPTPITRKAVPDATFAG